MRFSILIPLYNVEKYIFECLDSCLNQTFEDFEIIIINDGSTDKSVEIVESFNDKRIKVFHKKNEGLLMARRDAVPLAQGDYVVFLDSDDKLHPNCLNYINDILKNNKDAFDILIYNLYEWNPESGKIAAWEPVFDDGTLFELNNKKTILEKFLLTDKLNNLVLKAVKRELLQSDDTDYKAMGNSSYGEDKLQSFYLLSNAKSIYYSSEPLYYYRNNPLSITKVYRSPEDTAKRISHQVEIMSKKYSKIWELDTPSNIEQLSVNRLNFLRHVFWNCFHGCSTAEQRKKCVKYNWFSLLFKDNISYMDSKRLSFTQRLELKLIYNKSLFRLSLINWIKGILT